MKIAITFLAMVGLAGCLINSDARAASSTAPPLGVELHPPALRLVYEDGRRCDVAVPADLVSLRRWSGPAPNCEGVELVEIIFYDQTEPVIQRAQEYQGYRFLRGTPSDARVSIWISYGGGYWALY